MNLIAKWSPDISEVSGSIGSFALSLMAIPNVISKGSLVLTANRVIPLSWDHQVNGLFVCVVAAFAYALGLKRPNFFIPPVILASGICLVIVDALGVVGIGLSVFTPQSHFPMYAWLVVRFSSVLALGVLATDALLVNRFLWFAESPACFPSTTAGFGRPSLEFRSRLIPLFCFLSGSLQILNLIKR